MTRHSSKDYADRKWAMSNELKVLGRAKMEKFFTAKEREYLIAMLHTRELVLSQYMIAARNSPDKNLFSIIVDDKKTAHDLILKLHNHG